MNLPDEVAHVQSYLAPRFRRLVGTLERHVPDPRRRQGTAPEQRVPLAGVFQALFAGMLAGCTGLRDVEELSSWLGLRTAGGQPVKKLSDTMLGTFVERPDPDCFRPVVVRQVHAMNRRKQLRPIELPCGVTVVDGKDEGTLDHDAGGTALPQHDGQGGTFYRPRVLRAVLSSAAGKPVLGQRTIRGRAGEITTFPDFARELHADYNQGRQPLFEILDVDAGMLSRETFRFVDQDLGLGFVAGLKENQPELLKEAERQLLPRWERGEVPEAITPWEAYQGKEIRRRLYRTRAMNGYQGWQNLRQVWLVVQETATWLTPAESAKVQAREAAEQARRDARAAGEKLPKKAREPRERSGKRRRVRVPQEEKVRHVTVELRFFVTNVTWNRLTPAQILRLVRLHWAVENDCFWALDVMWQEDRPAWWTQGQAVYVLGWLRLLAYNLTQYVRSVHLRARHVRDASSEPLPWRRLFALVRRVLEALGAAARAAPPVGAGGAGRAPVAATG